MEDNHGSVPVTSKTLHREDVIRHATRKDKIGIVLVNGRDSETSSDSEDENDRVEEGHVIVSWYPKGHEEEIEEGKLEVVDRCIQHGDIVRWADPSKGTMKGTITKMKVKADISAIGAHHSQVKNVDCSELTPLQVFYYGLPIALGSCVGIVHELLLKLTLKLKNGARCIVEGEQANMLADNTDQRDEDSPYYCELFYPGQSVSGPMRVFRDAQWINGSRPVFTGNQRVSCVVEEVELNAIRVRWQERGYNTNATDDLLTAPSPLVSGQELQNVSVFDHFNHDGIQVGDKAFYTLKECDVSAHLLAKACNEDQNVDLREQPDQKKTKHSGKPKEQQPDEEVGEKLEDNDSTCSDESADDEDSDHGNIRESRRQPASSRRSEARHQGATAGPRAHATRKRRQFRRKKKRHQVPVRLVPGERVCVEVQMTSKFLTVLWQDGSLEEDIPSTELLPVLHVDELEFFPGDFVIDKTVSLEVDYGIVQKSDNVQRTCLIKWVGRREGDSEEEVSVYDIGDHPDFNFKLGDVVVRLVDVNESKNEENSNNPSTPSCGQVLQMDADGRIHVLWTDQTTSAMLPQNVFVVQTHDHSSSGNTGSSSDEEWETTSDVSTDQEPFMENGGQPLDRNILDDIARRSVAALRNNDTDDAEEPVEESDARNEANAGLAEEARESQNSAEGDESVNPTVSSQGSNQSADVKTRPTENAGDNTEGLCLFSTLEELPPSHRFSSHPFQVANQRQFNSAIRKEIAGFKSHLPSGVMVKGFESRLDLYSMLIEGPSGTPYEDGVFIFDVQLPPTYPKNPPVVHYLSQCSEMLNPNLYEDGTVCVSLLGTWNGRGSETWTSKSNLCQLILSLQGLILVEEPYFNEAGYEKHKGSVEGAENSRMYNERVLIKMMQSLERLWRYPPETFRHEIKQHLKEHLPRLFRRIYNWLGLYAPSDFLQKNSIPRVTEEDSVSKPEFPLLPLSFGFCISLMRNLRSLERAFGDATT